MKSKSSGLTILYEDDYLIAVNKPARLATVPAEFISLRDTVLGQAQRQFEKAGFTPYVLHRLDAQTSGVLLLGKHEKDRVELEALLKHPDVVKTYVALLKGVPSGKVITKNLKARTSDIEVFAQTKYKVMAVFKGKVPLCSLIEAYIKTGRKHQIRQHFAGIGHPVIMDPRYGDERLNRKFRIRFRLGRQFLHAAEISFFHPFLKKPITIKAPLALDLQSTVKNLHFGQ